MRDFVTVLAHVHRVLLADGSTDSSTVKVALVTTAGVVIAAAITSYAATFQRHKAPPAPAPAPTPAANESALVRELRSRATRAEARATELELENDRLENMLWDHSVNPHPPPPGDTS